MNKFFKAASALMIALIMVLGMPRLAFASSISGDATVQGPNITLSEDDGWPRITAEEAARIIGGDVQASDLTEVWQKMVHTKSTPVTLSFKISAYQPGMKVFIFHYIDGAWKIELSKNEAEFDHTFTSFSPLAIFTMKTSSTPTDHPTTGDNSSVVLWGVLMCLSAAGAIGVVIFSKKRRTD